jgi:hypothetical protein
MDGFRVNQELSVKRFFIYSWLRRSPMRDIEKIIQSFSTNYPTVRVRQLEVSHPGADDDGLWFFQRPGSETEVQIESSTGMCPFLIETNQNDTRVTTANIDQTIEAVARLLHL